MSICQVGCYDKPSGVRRCSGSVCGADCRVQKSRSLYILARSYSGSIANSFSGLARIHTHLRHDIVVA